MITFSKMILGTALSISMASGVQATGIGVSLGGNGGLGVGVGASIGGSSGVSAGVGASLGGNSGVGAGVGASVGGSSGVGASVGANVGGSAGGGGGGGGGTTGGDGSGGSGTGGTPPATGGANPATGGANPVANATDGTNRDAVGTAPSQAISANLVGAVVWSSDNVALGIVERSMAAPEGKVDAYMRVSGALVGGNKITILRLQPRTLLRGEIKLGLSRNQFLSRAGF